MCNSCDVIGVFGTLFRELERIGYVNTYFAIAQYVNCKTQKIHLHPSKYILPQMVFGYSRWVVYIHKKIHTYHHLTRRSTRTTIDFLPTTAMSLKVIS